MSAPDGAAAFISSTLAVFERETDDHLRNRCRRRDAGSYPLPKSLRLDPIACDGTGLCAELLPEWIRLDDWGFRDHRLEAAPRRLEPHARRAVKECPKLALRFNEG